MNYEHLGNDVYIVKNQAGFRNALKHSEGCCWKHPSDWPTSYSATVVISTGYIGYNFPNVTVIKEEHLKMFKDVRNDR